MSEQSKIEELEQRISILEARKTHIKESEISDLELHIKRLKDRKEKLENEISEKE